MHHGPVAGERHHPAIRRPLNTAEGCAHDDFGLLKPVIKGTLSVLGFCHFIDFISAAEAAVNDRTKGDQDACQENNRSGIHRLLVTTITIMAP